MAETTGIAWAHHTFNPATGCTRVSPGCDHCYAADMAKRNPSTFGSWEPGAPRKRTSPANWRDPRKWNRKAADAGERRRVFCASMADVFDNQWPVTWREDLWELIRETPSLDWLLLTKRPQNIARMLPPDWGEGYRNVWLGTTAENHGEVQRRVPVLQAVPARIHFLSCEPLIDFIDLAHIRTTHGWGSVLDGWEEHGGTGQAVAWIPAVSWVIVGGESGPGARPMRREWAEALLRQCEAAGVPAFFKQVGSNRGPDWPAGITGKGDDPAQWPESFRVQQFPEVAHA